MAIDLVNFWKCVYLFLLFVFNYQINYRLSNTFWLYQPRVKYAPFQCFSHLLLIIFTLYFSAVCLPFFLLFQSGNTPEHYTENKTENDFNDLVEFVEKRKNLQDSGRSSSMSLSRGSPSNVAGTVCSICTMLQKLSKCEVKAWLGWNLIIILTSNFMWNQILMSSNDPKMSFLAILETLNFEIC